MKPDSFLPSYNRRSMRLKDYDYSSDGLYFITICTEQRRCLFARVFNAKMRLTYWGGLVSHCWEQIPAHFPQIILHDYVVMPNHIHGILQINNTIKSSHNADYRGVSCRGETSFAPATHASPIPTGTSNTIGSVVRGFKIGVTCEFHKSFPRMIVWQRNYHEHIIRTQQSYDMISNYILDNPNRWIDDCFFEEW